MARVALLLVFVSLISTLTAAPDEPKRDPAVEKALKFLAAIQAKTGEWQQQNSPRPAVGITALAVLAFLSAGVDPADKTYGPAMKKGVTFLVSRLDKNGVALDNGFYGHGMAMWALAEYQLASGKQAPEALKKALDVAVMGVVAAQHDGGGWRYSPKEPGDLSVTSWVMLGLKAAEMAGAKVPEKAIKSGKAFMQTCKVKDAGFTYTPSGGSTPAMNAAGTLHLLLDGAAPNNVDALALKAIIVKELGKEASYALYASFYQAQALGRLAGDDAEGGLKKLRDTIAKAQGMRGNVEAAPKSAEQAYGPGYSTAMGVLILTSKDQALGVMKPQKAPE
jgi:hypothetical protein